MSKLVLTSIAAAVALGLAACGGGEDNVAIENIEDLNAAEDMNMSMDMNADMNMDMNVTGNASEPAADNSMDNSATTNSY